MTILQARGLKAGDTIIGKISHTEYRFVSSEEIKDSKGRVRWIDLSVKNHEGVPFVIGQGIFEPPTRKPKIKAEAKARRERRLKRVEGDKVCN